MRDIKRFFLVLVILLTSAVSYAADYRVVFDLTSNDQKTWDTILRNLENVKKELGDKTQLQVVAHGGGIELFLKKKAFQTPRLIKLSQAGVKFVGCENTMKRKKIKRDELYPFVATVPAGLAEIIRKQQEGWAYLKIGQ